MKRDLHHDHLNSLLGFPPAYVESDGDEVRHYWDPEELQDIVNDLLPTVHHVEHSRR